MNNNNATALHPSAPARDLRAEVAAIQTADPKMIQAEISRQSGIHPTRLNLWLKGTYTGDNETLEAELSRWVDAYHTRRLEARALPKAPDWQPTPTGERILAALGYAQIAQDISLIYGGAGLGKTKTVEHHARTNPNVWVATMTPSTKGVIPALGEIAEALGIENSATGAAPLRKAIVKRMKGTMGLLVIDEAQHLNTEALDEIRSLHDATGIGIALVGNETVYARMTGGDKRAAYLDRLFSRIGKRVRLVRSTAADIDLIIGAWGISARECKQLLHDIASKPGGLRGLTKTLRLASMFAAGNQRAVGCEDIRAAWRDLSGE